MLNIFFIGKSKILILFGNLTKKTNIFQKFAYNFLLEFQENQIFCDQNLKFL